MLSGIFQKRNKIVKPEITKVKRRRKHRIFLRPDMAEAIRQMKDWKKRGFATRLAERTDYTRQLCNLILKGYTSVEIDLALQIADLAGCGDGDCWCYLFSRKHIDIDENHPSLNAAKYNGQIPYSKFSTTAETRKHDYLVEQK